ncbi:Phage tail protein [compost metagenome]
MGALRRVVEPFGYLIEVKEWWQVTPPAPAGTFALKIGVTDAGISESTYQELSSLIDDARPVSRHLTGLVISLESRGALHVGCAIQDGDELDIYPPAPRDIEVVGTIGRGGREHTIDTLDIAHG